MNKIGMITLGAAIILGGSIGFGAINQGFAQENDSKKVESKASNELIGMEKAKAVALEQVDRIVESVELEKDDGQTYYEVDIDKGNKDFDIDVDAYTAKIIRIDESHDDDDDDNVKASATTKGSLISEKEAIAIAKKNIAGEVVEIELDEDDGRYEYEMELRTSNGEAEITIDAGSGKVLELEIDEDDRYDD